MRHLGSVLLSLVLAPLIWLGAGVGLSKFGEGLTSDPDHLAAFVGALAIAVAGALYGILVMTRLSPLGPMLVSLVYFGITIWALVSLRSLRDVLPEDAFGVDNAVLIPLAGFAALLAVPLLATVASPRRWRRYAHADAATHPTVYGSPAASAAGTSPYASYPSPYPASSYAPAANEPDDTRPLPPGG